MLFASVIHYRSTRSQAVARIADRTASQQTAGNKNIAPLLVLQ